MRDAFGGVFMIRLFLVFLFIYIAFAAVSMNYAKAFRLKNSLISFVEEEEIIDLSQKTMSGKLAKIDYILAKSSYNKTCKDIGYNEGEINKYGKTVGYCYKGIVIEELSSTKIEGTKSKLIKYEITTSANWNIGVLNKLLLLAGKQEEKGLMGFWKIKGEAQVVQRG